MSRSISLFIILGFAILNLYLFLYGPGLAANLISSVFSFSCFAWLVALKWILD